MKLVFDGTTIFDDSAHLPAAGLTINGVARTQVDEGLRAENAAFQFRGNLYLDIRFSVSRKHDSLRAAEEFLLLHPGSVSGKGGAVLTLGTTGDSSTATGASSVLTCSGTRRGVHTTFNYGLQVPKFELT